MLGIILIILVFFICFSESISLIFPKVLNFNPGNSVDNECLSKIPINDIYQCSLLSELVYEFDYGYRYEPTKCINFLNNRNFKCPNFKFIKFIRNKTNLNCLVTRNDVDRKYIVVFKGSNKLINWYFNIQTRKINFEDDCYVHRGFYQQILTGDILGQLKKLIKNSEDNYEWLFCGHSAGGAHSLLSSYLLSKEFPERKFNTFSFATPRIGNKAFADKFSDKSNLNHWRISYKNDFFTAIPFFNYKHFGYSIRLSPDMIKCGDYNKYFTFSVFKCNSLFDHNPRLYTRELEKIVLKD